MFEAHKEAKTFAESFMRLENEDLRKRLAALRSENAELMTQHRTEHCEAAGYDCEELGMLRAALSRVEAERDAAQKEIERMKDIMRQHGIMVIPGKHPGSRPEWNISRGAQGEG